MKKNDFLVRKNLKEFIKDCLKSKPKFDANLKTTFNKILFVLLVKDLDTSDLEVYSSLNGQLIKVDGKRPIVRIQEGGSLKAMCNFTIANNILGKYSISFLWFNKNTSNVMKVSFETINQII